MTIHDAPDSDQHTTVSGSISPYSTNSLCPTDESSSVKVMEDHTEVHNRQPTMVRREKTLRSAVIKPHSATSAEVKSANIGVRAMSAQERSSLSMKMRMEEEAARMSEAKSKVVKEQSVRKRGSDDQRWRDSIREQMEAELDQRVRDALETPPPERPHGHANGDNGRNNNSNRELENLNAHVLLDLSDKERNYLKSRRWKAIQAKRQMQKFLSMNYGHPTNSSRIEVVFRDELSKSNQDEYPGVFGLNSFSEGVKDLNEIHRKQFDKYPTIRQLHKQYYTKEGYLTASRNGKFSDGTVLDRDADGSYEDKFGVVRNQHGPFWPNDWGPLYPAPKFLWNTDTPVEPLYYFFKTEPADRLIEEQKFTDQNYPTVESQVTSYTSKWRGVLIVFDSERSSRDHFPNPVPQGCCPSLLFESRFECGNLRQARRVGQFEYELVLKTDLYTNRHTQWYYFRVQNAVPGVTYRFRIVNLLKRDSLYNYGMRPLLYSELDAKNKGVGWGRTGHHISYSRNIMHLHCPLLMRGVPFYELEFQMDFPNADDTYYLAHCYPYTFTDLKDDLENLLNDSARQHYMQREVLCETRAGNSCFLVTVTNFDQPESIQEEKKAVVITGRVHPGESQASWMMRGVLDYITGPSLAAQELRDKFIFKIVPMLNPDGVIVGNYRCSLAARDLNRNYRRPRKESFPTVWSTKDMIEKVMEKHEVALYCDLHGHSRKHNVFMYGNNTSTDDPDNNTNGNGVVGARGFLNERLFPWLMAQKSPEKFSFPFCKFNIKRCKEATGRVVMWRQMRILNSFTLEATFSGTAMNNCRRIPLDECRHFNISDYMEMGHILCQCVLEYHNTQENKARQTEIVLEMTRYLTCQVLERRRGVSYKMPNLKAFIKQQEATRAIEEDKNTSSQDQAMDEERSRSVPNEDNSIVAMETVDPVLSDRDEKVKRRDRRVESRNTNNGVNNLSKLDVENLLDTENMKTMDGCLKILAQLNVSEALEESDSSDSDSESEPELKPPPEPKQKKKKRKSKKQRDKEQQDRKGGSGGSDKKEERRMSTNCFQCTTSKCHSALPTISANQGMDPRNDGANSRGQGSSKDRYLKEKKDNAHFVSKYVGRKNGGIPCFAEERSVERAAKRMAEMKKRGEEEKQREMAFFMKEYLNDTKMEIEIPSSTAQIAMPQVHVKCVEEAGICQCGPNRPAGMPTLRRSLTNDELQRRLQVALNEGTSNIAQTLVGLNVRTGYTHADSFRDLAPAVLPATAPQNNNNSSEPSDSENENLVHNSIPVSARATPFQHENATMIASTHPFQHTTSTHAHHIFKKHLSLRGPSMKSSMGRQVTNSAQGSLNYGHHAATQLTRSDMSPANDSQRKYEDKKRAPGPLQKHGQKLGETKWCLGSTADTWSQKIIVLNDSRKSEQTVINTNLTKFWLPKSNIGVQPLRSQPDFGLSNTERLLLPRETSTLLAKAPGQESKTISLKNEISHIKSDQLAVRTEINCTNGNEDVVERQLLSAKFGGKSNPGSFSTNRGHPIKLWSPGRTNDL
ncbi:uncharacterized protein LOC128205605 isoform X4 [Mya arenaria]|uniref:uncharacterized protein LOC128205605 isoform X4 n=1 Tax=Mya arenaria TaxID=6604 RepID=UPI0022E7A91B|nr:uncharacterized protein LOC128205605 isoform X4 [Mya arenaria]